MDRNNTGWIIAVVILVILIGGFFWWKGTSTAPTDTPSDQNTTVATTTTTPAPQVVKSGLSTSTVSDVINGIPEASQFASYFSSTGVQASLSATGKYTVFVPTNGAFALLAPGTLSSMTAAQKKRWIQYHVVAGKKLDIDAINNGRIAALSTDTLNFMVSDDGTSVQVNSSFAIKSYETKNGIVYLINGVLLPPEQKTQ